MRFAALGRTEYLYDAILALHRAGHQAACVVTAPAAPEYVRREQDFEALASEMSCPFRVASHLHDQDVLDLLRNAEVAVSVNWPSILSNTVLDLFLHGVLNIHAGDLPRYRGNACPNWAILQGEDAVTLSVHVMLPDELDCGRVLSQRSLALTDETYIADVNAWILSVAPEMFVEAVQGLERDPDFALKTARADDPEALRCYPRVPEDGYIDWTRPALDIHRLVRASSTPLPGAYTYAFLDGRLTKIHVLRAHPVEPGLGNDLAEPGQVLRNDPATGESLVACGRGTVLALEQCQVGDGEPFAPGKAWRSIRARLGTRAEDVLWNTLHNQGLAD